MAENFIRDPQTMAVGLTIAAFIILKMLWDGRNK